MECDLPLPITAGDQAVDGVDELVFKLSIKLLKLGDDGVARKRHDRLAKGCVDVAKGCVDVVLVLYYIIAIILQVLSTLPS